MAEMVIRFHYLIWAIHCVALTVTVLLAGLRLVRILASHLDTMRIGRRAEGIKNAIFKVHLFNYILFKSFLTKDYFY